ncbi:MAG: hypothetical protein JW729_06695 [Bacteroidales bacterium]|nr:hypothetical protein [Bacteroidales bacterium]
MRIKTIVFLTVLGVLSLMEIKQTNAQNVTDGQGKKQGAWIKSQGGIKIYQGQFLNDIPVGEFIYFYPNGKVKIKTRFSENGKVNHTKMFFDLSGKKIQAEGKYVEKQKDSTWNYYNEDGILVLIENYKQGKKHGEYLVHNYLGQLHLQEFYVDGLRSGVSSEYFETGELFRQINFEKGIRKGLFKLFLPNGIIQLEGNYQNDLREGIWTTYNIKGEVEFLDHYKNGVLIRRTNQEGKELKIESKEEDMIPLDIDPSQIDPTKIH